MTREYQLGERAVGVEENRRRILDAAHELTVAAGFHPVSLEDVAKRAGTTRVTVYRQFGSKSGLFEAVMWDRIGRARLERLDRARERPDPVDALRAFLRENCRLFTEIGEASRQALEVARTEPDIARVVELSYYGRRIASLTELAARLARERKLAPGWSQDRVVDALMVLTSLEAFDSLTRKRGRSPSRAADTLFQLARGFLGEVIHKR